MTTGGDLTYETFCVGYEFLNVMIMYNVIECFEEVAGSHPEAINANRDATLHWLAKYNWQHLNKTMIGYRS